MCFDRRVVFYGFIFYNSGICRDVTHKTYGRIYKFTS